MFETLVRSNGGLLYSLFESIGEFTVHEVHYRSSCLCTLHSQRAAHGAFPLNSLSEVEWKGLQTHFHQHRRGRQTSCVAFTRLDFIHVKFLVVTVGEFSI